MAVSKQEKNINRVRAEVRETISIIGKGPEASAVATEQSCLALREISALRQELADDKAFRAAMTRVGFDRSGTELIIKGLNDQRGFQKGTMEAIARVPFQDITTERLNAEFTRHMATPECRRDLVRPSSKSLEPGDLNPTHEFAPFLVRLVNGDVFPKVRAEVLARLAVYIRSGHAAKDFTSTDTTQSNTAAMRDLVKRLRDGETVSAQEVEGVLANRFDELFVSMKVLRNKECVEGILPMAFPADSSSFSMRPTDQDQSKLDYTGSVEGSGRIDAVIRDVNDLHRWHIAAATSNEDTTSQGDQLARHHAAIRNSIEMGIPPFNKQDSIGTLLFVSPCLMIQSRIDLIQETGPSLTAAEIAAFNALGLHRQMSLNTHQRQMELISNLRYEHQSIGGVSSAAGGLGRSESQLVVAAAAQFARAVRALGHPKRQLDLESHGTGPLLSIIQMVQQTGTALLGNFAADAENGLRQAAPGLRHLAEQANEQGLRGVGDPLLLLAQQIEAIGPDLRERKPIECRRPNEEDRPRLMATYFNTLSLEQQFRHLKEQNGWSESMHQRWVQAREKASPAVWDGLVQGTFDIRDLDAARSGKGKSVLSMTKHEQGAWAHDFPTKKACQDADENVGARVFSREKSAQDFRSETVLSKEDLSGLVDIQKYGSSELWNAVINQVVPIADVVDACSKKAVSILDTTAETQDRWLKSHLGVYEVSPSISKRLSSPGVSDQHTDFLERVRPAMEKGWISDATFTSFNLVAQKGSARLYEQAITGRISAQSIYNARTEEGEHILDQSKSAQNQWLQEKMSSRNRTVLAPAAVVIATAYAEDQKSTKPRRRRKSTNR